MRDKRLDAWAQILVDYSLEAKAGQRAVLSGDVAAMPLLEACYEKLVKTGCHVETFIRPKEWSEFFFKEASQEQLEYISELSLYSMKHLDLYLTIGSDTNAKLLANADPKKQGMASKARRPIIETLMQRAAKEEARWVLTHYPTASAAQEANMGTTEYEEYVMNLCHLNEENPIEIWRAMSKRQQKIAKYLNQKKELHFKNAQGTDLKVNISGQKWVECSGHCNFPDGEVFSGPNIKEGNGGVEGIVRYSLPTLYRNVEVHDIELRFEKGAVVEARASKGEAFLKEMIQLDAGAKYVGEIAIGTNRNVDRITKNILFDEKFGGTFHLALGAGYPETGNDNQSGLHWDMIFDLREGGTITADGELFYQDGDFLLGL